MSKIIILSPVETLIFRIPFRLQSSLIKLSRCLHRGVGIIEIQICGLILLTATGGGLCLRQFSVKRYLPKIDFSAAVNTTSSLDNTLDAFTGTLSVG